jgi:hypothetical protein
MKKGDKVRFLSEVGGGKVAGFQGKNIVLVEDEDGFEIPMPINEVVVVEQDDYAMGKMISAKMDAKQKAEEHANTELHQDSRSIKAILNEHENEETHQKLMTIKRSFRLLMNGPGSQSMRDKGLGYKLNWGVPFYELKKMAQEYGKDYDLAIELWKEDIRECKILATLIMPADKMLAEITDIWMEQVQSQEMAEMLAFNLLQYVEYAPVIAYQWIASNKPLYEIAGFQLLARLFANGKEPNDRGINEFLDQAAVALQGDNMGVKHAAANAVMRFCDFGEDFENIARGALKGIFEI